MRKNSELRVKIPTELKECLSEIKNALYLTESNLVRAILWERIDLILKDLRSSKKTTYLLVTILGRESLSRQENCKEEQ